MTHAKPMPLEYSSCSAATSELSSPVLLKNSQCPLRGAIGHMNGEDRLGFQAETVTITNINQRKKIKHKTVLIKP